MKMNLNKLPTILGLFFLVTGVIWVALAILHEGTILLLEPGIANLIVGALLLTKFGKGYTRYLVMAAGLYSLIICVYQFYAACSLLQFGLTTFAIASLIGYGSASLAFFYVIISSYMNAQAFVPSTVDQTDDKKD
ncbi:MAG: hypothetical protein H3Z50_03810 [archaeon]|nr:hypothetical protein [archaeon]MCP8305812.1 hypothetical protein [archaeon]